MPPLEATTPPDPDRVPLADVLRRRRQLVDMRKAEKVRRHNAGQPAILSEIDTIISLLDEPVADVDRQIVARLALAEQARLLGAVPGVGPTVPATLLGQFPKLGALCRRRVTSIADLVPHARESGTWRGTRRIRGDRRTVREALKIAALGGSRRVPALIAMRDRMKAAGKAPKTILIAVV